MKKLLTSAFLFFVFFTANAANNPANINNEASTIARQLANQIELNESEYIQVKNYTVEKLAFVAEITEMYSNNPEMMNRKLTEVEKDYQHKITSLLNVKQYENYLTINNTAPQSLPEIAEMR